MQPMFNVCCEVSAMLLFTIDLKCIAYVLKKRNKGMAQKYFKMFFASRLLFVMFVKIFAPKKGEKIGGFLLKLLLVF
jgi:hypothetical protein